MKKGLFLGASIILHLLSLLPFGILYLLADIAYIVLYHIMHYRKQVVDNNLRNAFPEKSETERKAIAKKFYRFLADQVVESIKMLSITERTIKKRFRLNNVNELERHFKNNKSIIAATGHYGNWEWGSLIITATIKEPVLVVYKPLTDKNYESLVNKMRSKFGALLVPMKLTLRKIIALKGQNYLAVLVTDQTPVKDEAQFFTIFLNQPTAVFLGVEKLAKLGNHAVVYCHINRYKRGYYECTFKTLFNQPANTAEGEITIGHTQELDRIIREKPELWLWSHRRWKFSPNTLTA